MMLLLMLHEVENKPTPSKRMIKRSMYPVLKKRVKIAIIKKHVQKYFELQSKGKNYQKPNHWSIYESSS